MTIIPKDWIQYVKTALFGLLCFAGAYFYIRFSGMSSELNKGAADTAIFLIGLSMVISSVSYYFNFLDWSVAYRKYLGLIGLAFALAHLLMSSTAFLGLFKLATWQQGKMWPIGTGALALLIFVLMGLISNTFSAVKLGRHWRSALRVGYIAVALVLAHVYLLKSARWATWYNGGLKTAPPLSLLIAIFALIVILLRVILWLQLKRQTSTKKNAKTTRNKRKFSLP